MQSEDSEFGHCREGALHVMLMAPKAERSSRKDEIAHEQLMNHVKETRCVMSMVWGSVDVHERRHSFPKCEEGSDSIEKSDATFMIGTSAFLPIT